MRGKAAGSVTWRQSLERRVGSEGLGKKGVLRANADAAAGDGCGSAAREERAQRGETAELAGANTRQTHQAWRRRRRGRCSQSRRKRAGQTRREDAMRGRRRDLCGCKARTGWRAARICGGKGAPSGRAVSGGEETLERLGANAGAGELGAKSGRQGARARAGSARGAVSCARGYLSSSTPLPAALSRPLAPLHALSPAAAPPRTTAPAPRLESPAPAPPYSSEAAAPHPHIPPRPREGAAPRAMRPPPPPLGPSPRVFNAGRMLLGIAVDMLCARLGRI